MITCLNWATGEEIGALEEMPTSITFEHYYDDYTYTFKFGVNNVAFFDKILFNSMIDNNFRYHAPKEGQTEMYSRIREKAKELAYLIDELCPPSREKSIAMTELETSVFWANASIARN